MPKDWVIYYNQIDIGIFLCFLELCLEKNNTPYNRDLFFEENREKEYNLVAIYKINNHVFQAWLFIVASTVFVHFLPFWI